MKPQPTNIEKARVQIVMDIPLIASVLLNRQMIETDKVRTMAVDKRGQIYYNKKFTDTLTVPQCIWGICHECWHVMGKHFLRQGNRDGGKWNWAGDAWINDTLDRAGWGQRIPNTVDRKGSADETVEHIYSQIPETPPNGPGNGQGKPEGGSGNPMDGDGLGEDYYDNGEPPLTEAEVKEIEGEIDRQIAEAAQVAKMKGKLPGWLEEIVSQFINVKTPWYDILERYMTSYVNSESSWKRPSRRFQPLGQYLPSTDKTPQMGEVVFQIDISGSVSKQEIEYYNGHVKRIVEMCRPSKVYAVYVDTRVQKVEEFDVPEEMQIRFYSGGGTDMTAGIEYIEEHYDPEVVVVLTDGYTPWPEKEASFPTIWCISSNEVSPVGETVHFEME